MHVYTFKKHTITREEVEELTKEDCVRLYAINKCDRITLEEFTYHHNQNMIDISDDYITIK